MQRRQARWFGQVVLVSALLAGLLGEGGSWAKGPRRGGPELWIVADRIVGFVPFTVSLYGKVQGAEPGRLELCRSEVAWLTDSSNARVGGLHPTGLDAKRDSEPEEPSCADAGVVRTPDGYDYARDMRFDRPGTYHVRLSMVDPQGHRAVSNTVQVNAF